MKRYPGRATVKAFGGVTRTAEALGAPITTVHHWCGDKLNGTGPDRLIPRWWSEKIEAKAAELGVQLPRPKSAPSTKRTRAAA
jgi:hypothetical protein